MSQQNLLKQPSEFFEAVRERFYPTSGIKAGFALPWQKLSHCRIRPSELSVWTGISGHGKSNLLSQVIIGGALEGKRSLVCSLEMKGDKTLGRLVRQVTGERFPSKAKIAAALEWLDRYVTVYDFIGRGDIPRLLRDFQRAADDGTYLFILDSLMCCGINEDDLSAQKENVHQLQLWAQKSGTHVALVAHSRKGRSEADRPNKTDVMGSSHIVNLADAVWSVWRDKEKEEKVNHYRAAGGQPHESLLREYDVLLECSKSREGDDEERTYGLYFDPASLQYRGRHDDPPQSYYIDMPF